MLISIDWIKDFVDLPELSPKELGERFTLSTAEVEDVYTTGEAFEKIKVAEILKIEKHPQADKLNLVTFNFGGKENKKVVCGAGNVRVGLKVPYAPLGVTLPNGMTLEPKEIRGVLSEGMLCSEEELGLAQESEGLLELPSNTQIGMNMREYFNEAKDIILDVDNKSLTHRPDLWGHYGIAREFAAIFQRELKNPFTFSSQFGTGNSPIKVKVEKDCSCLAYYGLSVDSIKVEQSPTWMQQRLKAVGLRPINNIVDISNYVMLELGIPLHIFDRHKISGDQVIIKALNKEENFVTLDEQNRELIPGDTIICDKEKTLVLAGIMGGMNSGVSDKTSNIFIEVANWKAAEVRRTSTRLGLRTDSSQRYEKTLDSQLCKRTMLRTLELILQLCPQAKVVGKLEYDGQNLSEIRPLEITTSVEKISRVLGTKIDEKRVISIFESLDFAVKKNGEKLCVKVPSYRATKDVEFEDDLIEEIGRIIGYDNIEPIAPLVAVSPVRLSPAQELHRKVRDFMTNHAQALEVMTYPMVGEKLLEKASWDNEKTLNIINSLSKEADRMRPSLLPNILQTLANNHKNFSEFRFFELGRSYHPDEKSFVNERSILSLVFFNKEKNDYLELVNSIQKLLASLNIPFDLCAKNPKFKNDLIPEDWRGAHPFEFTNIRIMGKMKGAITSIHPLGLRSFKIKGEVAVALIDLTEIEQQKMKDKTKYKSLPKFPSSSFDWTVVADKSTQVGDILLATKKAKIKEMDTCKVVDIYTLNDTQKSVTLRATFSDPNKTLSGEFITQASNILVETLSKSGYPLKQ